MNSAKCFVPRKRFIRDKTALSRRRSEICEAYTGDISKMNPEYVRKIRPFHGQMSMPTCEEQLSLEQK